MDQEKDAGSEMRQQISDRESTLALERALCRAGGIFIARQLSLFNTFDFSLSLYRTSRDEPEQASAELTLLRDYEEDHPFER